MNHQLKNIDDELNKNTILRFNRTLQNYIIVTIGNTDYDLTKYDRIQIRDTTNIKYFNNGGYLSQQWNMKCSDQNVAGKRQNFVKSTKINSPTGNSGAATLPPIGDSFMWIETSANNFVKMFLLVLTEQILQN